MDRIRKWCCNFIKAMAHSYWKYVTICLSDVTRTAYATISAWVNQWGEVGWLVVGVLHPCNINGHIRQCVYRLPHWEIKHHDPISQPITLSWHWANRSNEMWINVVGRTWNLWQWSCLRKATRYCCSIALLKPMLIYTTARLGTPQDITPSLYSLVLECSPLIWGILSAIHRLVRPRVLVATFGCVYCVE